MSFQNAHNFEIHNSQFYDIGRDQHINILFSSGFDTLRASSTRGAAFNSEERYPPPDCFEGTRQSLLRDISTWISNPISDGYFPICWLRGLAGSGKSAVAQTFAEYCARNNILAASFFFSRGNVDRSSAKKLFTTIAYQLSISIPSVRSSIESALHEDPSILDRILRDQVQHLIVNPLLSLPESTASNRMVIIDALDECDDPRAAQDVITILAQTLAEHRSLFKVFITSRPEFYIQIKFSHLHISPLTHALNIHDYDAYKDIRIFLSRRFDEILEAQSDIMTLISQPWPTRVDLERLVTESGGLFIFASTIIRFIDSFDEHPKDRLDIALRHYRAPELHQGVKPYAGLDELYKQVLSMTTYNHRTRLVLATIILLLQPLSIQGLGVLLGLDAGYITLSLRGLHSLLHIPNVSSPGFHHHSVRTLHISLRDFLTDEARSVTFYINPTVYHAELACYCLKLMLKSLKRDMCDIGSVSLMNKDVKDLPERVDKHLGEALRYACCYWVDHLPKVLNEELLAQVIEFSRRLLLPWIEVLSLLGELKMALPILRNAQDAVRDIPSALTLELFTDAERLVMQFFDPIEAAALQVYYSALPFSPSKTRIRQVYGNELVSTVHVVRTLDKNWNACLRTIPCPAPVSVIEASPDGAYLACGFHNGVICILDANSGLLIDQTEVHDNVQALSFSPDCRTLAYATSAILRSFDKDISVGLWDMQTRKPVRLGNYFPGAVKHGRFSPDGSLVVFFLEAWQYHTHHTRSVTSVWDVATRDKLYSFVGCSTFVFTHSAGLVLGYQQTDGLQLCLATLPDNPKRNPFISTQPLARPLRSLKNGNMPVWLIPQAPAGIWVAYRNTTDVCIERVNDNGDTLSVCTLEASHSVSHLFGFSISADGTFIMNTKGLQLWDLSSGRSLSLPNSLTSSRHSFITTKSRLISWTQDRQDVYGIIHIWDISLFMKPDIGTVTQLPDVGNRRESGHTPIQQSRPAKIKSLKIGSHHLIIEKHTVPALQIQDWNTGQTLDNDEHHSKCLAISSDGSLFAWWKYPTIDVWAITSRRATIVLSGNGLASFPLCMISEDLQYIIIIVQSITEQIPLVLFSLQTGAELQSLGYLPEVFNRRIRGVATSRDGSKVASLTIGAYSTLEFWTWEIKSGTPLVNGRDSGIVDTGREMLRGVFTLDGSLVAFAGTNLLFLWDAVVGSRLWQTNFYGQNPIAFYALPHFPRRLYILSSSSDTFVDGVSPSHMSSVRVPAHHLYRVRSDGWVVDGLERVCWIPNDWVPKRGEQASRGHKLAVYSAQRDVYLLLDFSRFCRNCPYSTANEVSL